MAAVSCNLLFTGRRGSDNIDRNLVYVRVYEVYTDDPEDEADAAAAHPDIPRNGDPYDLNPDATMTSIEADNGDQDPLRWLVTCTFTTGLPTEQARESGGFDSTTGAATENPGAGESGGSGPGATDRAANPLDRPKTVHSEWETVEEPFEFDVNGDPVLNSAGYPFDPPKMIERSYRVLTISKNYAVNDPLLDQDSQQAYQDAVNDATWAGFAAGTCRILSLVVDYDYENTIPFARATFRIKIKPEGWNPVKIIDRGYYDFLGARIAVVEGTSQYPDEPSLLNGAGDPLAAGLPPVTVEYDAYGTADYSALGI